MAQLAAHDGPVVALFTAPTWCRPCQRLEPHWNAASERAEGTLFIKVDMGENPDDTFAHWATERYTVMSVPTLKFWSEEDFTAAEPTTLRARTSLALLKEIGHG